MNRRSALHSVAIGASVSLAGCFGIGQRIPPDEGEMTVRNMADDSHAISVTLTDDDRVTLDETYELAADESGPTETVEPATYAVTATLDGERTEQFEWEVTNCRSSAFVQVWPDGTLGFETSNC